MSGVRVGVTLPQFTDKPERLIDGARRAEDCGLDSIWLFDHLWPLTGGRTRPLLECWTSLAYIAAATDRVTVGTLVTRSSMRHPAMLAKMAATANEIAPGRLAVAVGSGDALSRPENESVGLPYFEGRARVAQLASTVSILRSFFADDEVDHADTFVNMRGFPARPKSSPPPPIWVAGRGEGALDIAATLGDGWNGWGGTPEEYARDWATVRERADGRRVEATWAGLVLLASSPAEAQERVGRRPPNDSVAGDFEGVRERLAGFVAAGAEHVIATFPDSGRPGNFEALAEMKPFLSEDVLRTEAG
jgi:alkanesulfonate monooxygenase SsuD/methylene tetrahydromethanopterin reductase-like flavin-dependent oxidoreductase (luciferase family)